MNGIDEINNDNWFGETSNNNLTPEQEAHLLVIELECDNPDNLVPHDKAVKQIEQWLQRPPQ